MRRGVAASEVKHGRKGRSKLDRYGKSGEVPERLRGGHSRGSREDEMEEDEEDNGTHWTGLPTWPAALVPDLAVWAESGRVTVGISRWLNP